MERAGRQEGTTQGTGKAGALFPPHPFGESRRQQGFLRPVLRIPAGCGRLLIRIYRYTFSPLVGFNCRHLPTCSEYGDQAIERYGLWAGGWMTFARLCRCHPLGTAGLDFVCEELPPRARWYLPWRYARWRGTNEGPAPRD